MIQSSIQKITASWNELTGSLSIEPLSSISKNIHILTTCQAKQYILKQRNKPDTAIRESFLLPKLVETIPVALPVKTIEGNPFAEFEHHFYTLYPKLPGQMVINYFEGDYQARSFNFGKSIARLHQGLRLHQSITSFPEMNYVSQLNSWVKTVITNSERFTLRDEALTLLKTNIAELSILQHNLTFQLIHRDPHPSNMLFEDHELTGFLDFDMLTYGPKLFDPCYCSSSILSSGFLQEEYREKWRGIHQAIFQGYLTLENLSLEELRVVFPMFISIQFLFLAFNIKKDNYTAAKFNLDVLKWASQNKNVFDIS